jgi:hypothetical protein
MLASDIIDAHAQVPRAWSASDGVTMQNDHQKRAVSEP